MVTRSLLWQRATGGQYWTISIKKNYMNLTHANADINSEYVFAFQLKFCEQILHKLGRGGNQFVLIAFLF